jgi:release factor glutamine methyltransferase
MIQSSVLQHEPHKALFAENDGLFFIQKLIEEGKKHLRDTGILFIEIDPHQKDPVLEYTKKAGADASFWKDQFNNDRVALISYTNTLE